MGARNLFFSIASVLTFVAVLIPKPVMAVAFKSSLTQIRALTNAPFSVSLNDFLDTPSANTQWAMDTAHPSWLVFDTAHIGATPPSSADGVYTFKLYGTDSQSSSFTQIELTIIDPDNSDSVIDLGAQNVSAYFISDLKPVISNPSHASFSLLSDAPGWIKVTPDGIIYGIPQAGDVGTYTFCAATKDDSGNISTYEIIGSVVKMVDAPKFIASSLVANDEAVNEPYSLNIAGAVHLGAATTLTFSLVSGPSWITLTSDGLLKGTPAATNIGPVTVAVKLKGVIDGALYEDTTLIRFNVL